MSPNGLGKLHKASGIHLPAIAGTAGFKLPLFRFFALLFSTLFMLLTANPASAADPDNKVSFTLEGCKIDAATTLPIAGKFVCPDSFYTTGNMGKEWSELDLVPWRLTTKAGIGHNQQQYTIGVVVDRLDDGKPGFDILSGLTLNTAKSDPSCKLISVSPSFPTAASTSTSFGGIDQSIYRLVTIQQDEKTECVFDYWARLALDSHLFPGSSLHGNLALPTAGDIDCNGIGCRDVSIPVNEIEPQKLSKTMSARQDADHTWNLTKKAEPIEAPFGNVCAKDAPTQKDVNITVTWEKLAATKGATTVVANITATNPAARDLTVNLCDSIFKGPTPSVSPETQTGALDTKCFDPVVVAAGKDFTFKHEVTLTGDVGSVGDYLNDVATATYTDVAFPDQTIPGKKYAFDDDPIQKGNVTNTTAVITDTESISGTGLAFSVATPSVGSFLDGYIAGTKVPTSFANPVKWSSGTQSDSGSVTFVKTIYLEPLTVTSGKLEDTASLKASDGFAPKDAPANVTISSSAAGTLTIEKTINKDAIDILGVNEKYRINFTITRKGDVNFLEKRTLEFQSGETTTKSLDLANLEPDTYYVNEAPLFVDKDGLTSSGVIREEKGNPDRTVDLSVTDSKAICTGKAAFTNVPGFGPAQAKVAKVTDPTEVSGDDVTWTFTLKGTGLPDEGVSVNATANAPDPVLFEGLAAALQEGSFTITETLKPGWDQSGVKLGDGVFQNVKTCSFSVDYPQDANVVFTCTFKNTKRGKAEVIKTVSGVAPSGDQSFKFQLMTGASPTEPGTAFGPAQDANAGNGGKLTFADLKPGSYQLCEMGVLPGWTTTWKVDGTLTSTFVPNSDDPNVDNSTICASFTVSAGKTVVFEIDNVPPPKGDARTIGYWKNWASCKQSGGKQAPVLDRTMALAEPSGILDDLLLSSSTGLSGLHGSVADPDVAPDCSKAVSLLNKSTFGGAKKASDPLFNMAAQLVAAELNYAAGAGTCAKVTEAIAAANALLTKYQFTGNGYTGKVSATDASLARSLATRLDNYNNNLPSACL